MNQKLNKIVFFGSGDLAAKSLKLITENFDVEAVITKAAKNSFQKELPVYDLSENLGIPTFTVLTKTDVDKVFENNSFNSTVGILIDFGIIINNKVINYFPKGIINSHFSILPEWRGPDPITFSILSGQTTTGVSLMRIVDRMNEGPLIGFKEIKISPEATNTLLSNQLIDLSNQLINYYLPDYINNTEFEIFEQNKTGRKVSYSSLLKKNDGKIDFSNNAAVIERQIRAFEIWPKSKTTLNNTDIIISKAHILELNGSPSEFFIYKNSFVGFFCKQGSIVIDELVPAGKKKMTSESYINGHKEQLSDLKRIN